ncbi:MAG: aldo/keto reductase [Paenibacillaceae bacterium]|nr:aldo/keto reductase [Paenibacillaceae bacterium]
MNYFTIPGVAKKCSQLILGTDYYKVELMDQISVIMDEFLAIGGTTLDTAHNYGGGRSEVAIGQWLKERGNREKVTILTKGAHPDKDNPSRVGRKFLNEDIDCSLERLQTNYLDMWALHRDDPSVPVSEIIDTLNERIQAGHIQAIGVSNWSCARIDEANEYAKANGKVGFTFSSINLSLAKPNEPWWKGCVSADEQILAWHEARQMPNLSWSSQARGFFSGRFSPEDRSDKDQVRVFYSDANWERLRRAEQLGKEKGVSTIQIALAYVLNQPFPSAALVGPQNISELHSSHDGTQIKLTREELAWLDLSAK